MLLTIKHGVMFELVYHPAVIKEDIKKLSPKWGNTIRLAIEQKLKAKPELFGKPLRKSLKGYKKLRVGDYRVIFLIEKSVVKIIAIMHRSAVYTSAVKRK